MMVNMFTVFTEMTIMHILFTQHSSFVIMKNKKLSPFSYN